VTDSGHYWATNWDSWGEKPFRGQALGSLPGSHTGSRARDCWALELGPALGLLGAELGDTSHSGRSWVLLGTLTFRGRRETRAGAGRAAAGELGPGWDSWRHLGQSWSRTGSRAWGARPPLGDELGPTLGDELGAALGPALEPVLENSGNHSVRTRSQKRVRHWVQRWVQHSVGARSLQGRHWVPALSPA
jgi:hypothetical protein